LHFSSYNISQPSSPPTLFNFFSLFHFFWNSPIPKSVTTFFIRFQPRRFTFLPWLLDPSFLINFCFSPGTMSCCPVPTLSSPKSTVFSLLGPFFPLDLSFFLAFTSWLELRYSAKPKTTVGFSFLDVPPSLVFSDPVLTFPFSF